MRDLVDADAFEPAEHVSVADSVGDHPVHHRRY
jgi:hypothetical protein